MIDASSFANTTTDDHQLRTVPQQLRVDTAPVKDLTYEKWKDKAANKDG
jgi:hypothetical protein